MIALCLVVFAAPVSSQMAPPLSSSTMAPRTVVKASLVVKVANRDQSATALIAKTSALGGFFASATDSALVLKVPADKSKELLAYAASLGVVVARGYDSEDVGLAITEQRQLLASHQQLLQSYLKVLREAAAVEVVTVEKETVHLIEQIELLQGQILQEENQLSYATVSVDFQFRERQMPKRDGRSSFAWLNALNLSDLIADFGDAND